LENESAGSKQPLKIELHEPLDYLLLKNAIRVVDNTGTIVNGVIESEAQETMLNFTPTNS